MPSLTPLFLSAGHGTGINQLYILGTRTMMDMTIFVLVEQDSANGEYKKWGFVHFFYGGNPLSSIPAYSIFHPAGAYAVTACDVSRDSYRDLIIGQKSQRETDHWYKVYYGGPDFDTIRILNSVP
ncbi:MAG: hypothetical protein IPN18_05395 [Ignavibacteriales bacterium]|nr:hypothetical protein [Ignavibacteriales bacterium]